MTDTPPESETSAAAEPAEKQAKRKSLGRRLAGWAIDLAIVGGLLFGIRAWQARDVVSVDAEAPGLVAQTLDGERFDLEDLRGDVVQVRFQATWCGACNREQGAVNRLAETLESDEHLVTVFDPEALDTIRAHVDEHEVPGTIVVADSATQRAWGVSAFPTNVWVRPDGTVASRSVGLTTRPVMRWHLDDARP